MDITVADGEVIVKEANPSKRKGQDFYEYYLQLNPNKAVSDRTLIKKYSDFDKVLREAFERLEVVEFRLNRADLSFNTDNESDYELFKKLNRLLICCISENEGIDNCYETNDLWKLRSLSVAIKSNRLEVENYNKELESKGKTEAKTRLELRSKCLSIPLEELPKEFTEKWFARLDGAYDKFKEVQDRYNQTLIDIWKADQLNDSKNREFINFTAFLQTYKDCIFTKAQLIDLFERTGVSKNPTNSANHYKDNHKIEFYSKTDLREIIKAIKKCTLKYFSN